MNILAKLYEAVGNPINSKKLRWMSVDLITEIRNATPTYRGTSFTECVYWFVHNITTYPTCVVCGTSLSTKYFKTFETGYRKFCSPKCSANDVSVKLKVSTTIHNKYGTHHSSLDTTKQKRISTIISKYGNDGFSLISNKGLAKRTGICQKVESINRRTATRLSKWLPLKINRLEKLGIIPNFDITQYVDTKTKYSWKCVVCNNSFRRNLLMGKLPQCPHCNPTISADKELFKWIAQYCPDAEYATRSVIYPKELDIYVPSKRIGIEYNGLYWHSEDRDLQYPKYHLDKTLLCAARDIRLIHIFEDEWINCPEIVKSRLSAIIDTSTTTKLYARKLVVGVVDSHTSNAFLRQNHLQGADTSTIRLGLFDGTRLVSLMTFCKSRFTNKYQWELSRFCTILNHIVIGGASKLFNTFIRQYDPDTVVSYSDRRWGEGNVYTKLGFIKDGTSPPSYYYLDKHYQQRHNRIKFQKHKLSSILSTFDPELSESENMKLAGYTKIWDCGTNRYVYTKPK